MASRPNVLTIPAHRSFADALAGWMLAAGEVHRATLLLPNRRAQRALTEAFVRLSPERGLLLPRMLPIGDVGEAEALGLFDGAIDLELDAPPAIDGFARRMHLWRLVARWRELDGQAASAVELLRLADALAATLDQLHLEGVPPAALATAGESLGEHWTKTRKFFDVVLKAWPELLASLGLAERMERRQQLLTALARRWRETPPTRSIVAAGIGAADPAVAELLATIARLPAGAVVLPGLDLETCDWDALHGNPSHPQAALAQLLGRMGVSRGEVMELAAASDRDGPPERTRAIAAAMALPETTAAWEGIESLAGVTTVEAANPAEEALVIALAMRRQLETPGASAALVTPDRGLARRVAAQLGRWGIDIDDTAGTPLSRSLPGTLLLAAVDAAASRFAPTALLALLKHPLAGPDGDARLRWLDAVRALDLALRGVRPPPGLRGIAARIASNKELGEWWQPVAAMLQPLEAHMAAPSGLADTAERLRAFVDVFAGTRIWRGPAGRQASELIAGLIADGDSAGPVPPGDLPSLLGALAADIAVRPPFGKHNRLAIYGLLEARLQRADLMILGGLNEGVWPARASFDPWLPPIVRRELGMPDTEREMGLAAHDFVMAAGAPQVLLTRAARDASAPAVPSRFWLRLHAYAGDQLPAEAELLAIARALDKRPAVPRARRPAPAPPPDARPRRISVTEVDRLRADPYSFYAKRVLGLSVLDPLDADPSGADKGNIVHDILEKLVEGGGLFDPAARSAMLQTVLSAHDSHPLLAALWQPRVERMIEWAAGQIAGRKSDGWSATRAERRGRLIVNGVELTGRADIVQLGAAGAAIADFKTGAHPRYQQISQGFAMQLGLLGLLVQEGALEGFEPLPVSELYYWKLSGGAVAGTAYPTPRSSPHPWPDVPAFIERCRADLETLVARLLVGSAPFHSKEAPLFALHLRDYDQLARVDEWRGQQ